jgi:hypothetical protein
MPDIETNSVSPGGQYSLLIAAREMRMSHWLEMPKLVSTHDQQTIFDLWDSWWSLDDITWDTAATCSLTLRRYPGNHTPSYVIVHVDCEDLHFSIGAGERMEIRQLKDALEQHYQHIKSR